MGLGSCHIWGVGDAAGCSLAVTRVPLLVWMIEGCRGNWMHRGAMDAQGCHTHPVRCAHHRVLPGQVSMSSRHSQ